MCLGAYQIVIEDRVPVSAAVDQSVRCLRAVGAERATGLANAVLRRLAAEHARIATPQLLDDPQHAYTQLLVSSVLTV